MPLFRQASPGYDELRRIAAFWAWWSQARPRIEAAVAASELEPLVGEITARVRDLHQRLTWEIGRGVNATNQLCLSGEGDIELRALTERWRRTAPSPDDAWEYWPARQADPAGSNHVLVIAGIHVEPDDLRFWTHTDENRERLDLTVWHPTFSTIEDDLRTRIAHLALDGLLSEDDVERWLGVVETTQTMLPGDPVDRAGLRMALKLLATNATHDRFVLGRATGKKGEPLLVLVNMTLKRIDHLDKSMRVRVTLRLQEAGANGLPSVDELGRLNALEARLMLIVPGAVFAGRVTGRERLISTGMQRMALQRWLRLRELQINPGKSTSAPTRIRGGMRFGTIFSTDTLKSTGPAAVAMRRPHRTRSKVLGIDGRATWPACSGPPTPNTCHPRGRRPSPVSAAGGEWPDA